MRPVGVAALTLPVWWGGYLLLDYPPTPVDYAAGLAVAVIAAAVTGVAANAAGRGRRWPSGILRTAAGLPWQVLRGYALVVAAGLAPGPVRGALRRVAAPGAGRADPAGAGRRAWIGWARSLSADEVVVGFPDDDGVLVHTLPGRRPDDAAGR